MQIKSVGNGAFKSTSGDLYSYAAVMFLLFFNFDWHEMFQLTLIILSGDGTGGIVVIARVFIDLQRRMTR